MSGVSSIDSSLKELLAHANLQRGKRTGAVTTVRVQPVLHQLRHDPVISLIAFASSTTSVLSDPRSSLCKRDQAWPFLTSKIAFAIASRRLPQDNQYGLRSTRCLYSAPSERAPMVIRRYFHNSPLSLSTSQCISRAAQVTSVSFAQSPVKGPRPPGIPRHF